MKGLTAQKEKSRNCHEILHLCIYNRSVNIYDVNKRCICEISNSNPGNSIL